MLTKDERLSALAEGVHTAWRKGTDARYAATISKLITDMEPGEWSAYIKWLDWALGEVGYREPDETKGN